MPFKETLDETIAECLADSLTDGLTIRRVFGFEQSKIFAADAKSGFTIINTVASRFDVPFRSVWIVGSAQTGYSYFKNREFEAGTSDLDLAIVDASLYIRLVEQSLIATRSFTDLTRFSNANQASQYRRYLSRGMLRPDLMPAVPEKEAWFTFFNRLSESYSSTFENINCSVFLSQLLLEEKQSSLIDRYRDAHP